MFNYSSSALTVSINHGGRSPAKHSVFYQRPAHPSINSYLPAQVRTRPEAWRCVYTPPPALFLCHPKALPWLCHRLSHYLALSKFLWRLKVEFFVRISRAVLQCDKDVLAAWQKSKRDGGSISSGFCHQPYQTYRTVGQQDMLSQLYIIR